MTMDTTASTSTAGRILREGFGPGAWHGPDLKAALADVTPAQAYWRAGTGHNIAEIALHHAYYAHSVRSRLSVEPAEAFPMAGEDWFPIDGERQLPWTDVLAVVERQQERLARIVEQIETGDAASPLSSEERFDVVLGITCHAVYHAGQIQLLKRLQRG